MADSVSRRRRSAGVGGPVWPLVLPSLVLIALVVALPAFFSLWASLRDYHLADDDYGTFTGFGNYLDLLGDERVLGAAGNTLQLALIATAVPLVLGLVTALALSRPGLRGRGVYLTLLMLPLFIPYVATGLIWLLILHPQQGILNYVLATVGLPAEPWLGQTSTALTTIALIDAWQHTSLVALLIYAGLGSVPHDVLEAARMDGAGPWRIFWNVTFPLLRPIIAVAAALRFVQSFLTYDLVYVLTQGGPASSTETLAFYTGRLAFRHLEIGQASALSWLLLIAVAAFAAITIRVGGNPLADPPARRRWRA